MRDRGALPARSAARHVTLRLLVVRPENLAGFAMDQMQLPASGAGYGFRGRSRIIRRVSAFGDPGRDVLTGHRTFEQDRSHRGMIRCSAGRLIAMDQKPAFASRARQSGWRGQIHSAIDFYERHPISAQIILTKLQAARGTLDGLRPEDLFPHDQDHYGGLAANDALAQCAHIGPGARVVDFCAGLGGPARYLAHRHGAHVIGIELTPARVAGAAELTRRVGLEGKVQVIEGDVTNVPLPDDSQDAVVSQEALLHVPDLAKAFAEAYRLLRPGGRIAFTNWVVHRPLSAAHAKLLWDGMAAATLIGIDRHAELLRGSGFAVETIVDETDAWGVILAERLRMYQKLRREAIEAGTPEGHDDFYKSYVLFVDLVQQKAMGGARFAAVKPAGVSARAP